VNNTDDSSAFAKITLFQVLALEVDFREKDWNFLDRFAILFIFIVTII
jgi:hypothetical protein